MKRTVSLLLTIVLIAGLFAACGNSGTTTATTETPAATDDAAPADSGSDAGDVADVAPGKKGSIEYWTVFTGADGTSMQAMVDSYNSTDPDYTVNHRAMPEADLYLKLPLAVQSGQDVPDISISHVERVRAFKDNGFLTDLGAYMEQGGISASNYNEKAWSMTELDGGHYGIPLDVHTYVLYVNMDLYEEYGEGELDDGVLTWDEVRATGARLEGTGITTMGLSWLRVKFLASYAQLGGVLSSDGETPDFNNDIAARALQNWIDLREADYINKDGDQVWEQFLGGTMLYCPEGIWMYNNIKESGLNARMLDYPVFDAGVKGNWTSSHQFVLPVNAARDDEKTVAALQFIDFMGNNSLEWAKAGQTPAHNSIKDDPEFAAMPQAFLADENEELKIYDYKYYGYAVEALDKVLPDILWGRATIEDGLAQAVQETKDKIEIEG